VRYSVIMPTYNRAQLITRAILSVADQDCIDKSSMEIIVIDDGSTDDTKQIVSGLHVAPVSLIYLIQPHVGQPGTTRNAGLAVARGEIIAYCDSDDLWYPHHLATAEVEFKNDPSLMMVSTHWGMAWFEVESSGYVNTQMIIPKHQTIHLSNTNCRIHKKACLDVGVFNASEWGEDTEFFQRIEARYKSKKVLAVTNMCGYTKGGNNLTYLSDPGTKAKYF
jgi:glycosyltransferase involved in cell wall biosynthesis